MCEPAASPRRSAPSAQRNRGPIAEILREELPLAGVVLELASGTGEHAAHFAHSFPYLAWQPSDVDPVALASIAARRTDLHKQGEGENLRAPIALDVRDGPWPRAPVAAVICINMVHISPVGVTSKLVQNAGKILERGGPLIVYGPFLEQDTPTAPSNLAFDQNLKARDPRWGLRRIEWLDELAHAQILERTRRVTLPSNSVLLVYRRG